MRHRSVAFLVSLCVIACGSSSKSPEPIAVSSAELGGQLFAAKGCAACHSIDGSARIGPTLKAPFGKRVQLVSGQEVAFDEAYFIESVIDPDAKTVAGYPRGVQPSFRGHLEDHEMTALIAFVKSSN